MLRIGTLVLRSGNFDPERIFFSPKMLGFGEKTSLFAIFLGKD